MGIISLALPRNGTPQLSGACLAGSIRETKMSAPIVAEDLYRFRWLDHVRLTSDGDRVAYQISWPDPTSRQNQSRIVVRRLLDAEPLEPTAGLRRDRSPEWSP